MQGMSALALRVIRCGAAIWRPSSVMDSWRGTLIGLIGPKRRPRSGSGRCRLCRISAGNRARRTCCRRSSQFPAKRRPIQPRSCACLSPDPDAIIQEIGADRESGRSGPLSRQPRLAGGGEHDAGRFHSAAVLKGHQAIADRVLPDRQARTGFSRRPWPRHRCADHRRPRPGTAG
jgi:hypothetical protein